MLERSRKRKEAKESTENKIEFVSEQAMELEDFDPEDLATNMVLAKKANLPTMTPTFLLRQRKPQEGKRLR